MQRDYKGSKNRNLRKNEAQKQAAQLLQSPESQQARKARGLEIKIQVLIPKAY